MPRMLNAVLLITLLGACRVGQHGEYTALARAPRGANIQLTTTHGEMRGELLDMRASGIVLLTAGDEVTLVEYEAIRHGEAEGGATSFTGASVRTGRSFEWLRLRSRFPQGLQPHVEAELLRLHNQTSLLVVRP